ncbi:MAG TPA: BON domain-containing protein [Terriglobia bacterium]|jgi:osmotically-inducible protein OsmY|nr:BON domain-containing protein [Terriglobia bacterium]
MMRILHLSGIVLISLALANCDMQTGRVEKKAEATTDADNTARNERDRNAATQLPTDQAENDADRQVSADVRKAITSDDSLSVNAQNVKIITSNGYVTLRGPVKTEREKEAIGAKAKQVAGVHGVTNLLEVEAKP